MTQTASLDATRVAEWRANIRRDITANYALGMAVALYRSDGAVAALPRLRDTGGMPSQETARQLLMAQLLREIGREGEADAILRPLQEGPARRMIDGLVELIAITHLSAGLEEVTESLVEQAAALLDTPLTADDRALVLAIRARQHLRRGRMEEGITDIRTLCAFPVNAMPAADVMIDILPELASSLARHGQNELALAVDRRALALISNPDHRVHGPLPGQQQIIQRLMTFGPILMDETSLSNVLTCLMERGNWADPVLMGTLAPMGVALLNRDLLAPLGKVCSFVTGQGEGMSPYRLWLLAEILACDPTPDQHAGWLDITTTPLPDNPRLLLAIARAFLVCGRLEEAEAMAARAVKFDSVRLLALSLRATLAILAGKEVALNKLCEELRGLPPGGERQAFNQQALALLSTGAAGPAFSLLDKGSVDNLPMARLLRGLALRALGRHSEAREEVKQLASSLSDNALRRLVNLARPVRAAAITLLQETGAGEGFSRNIVTITPPY